MRTTTPVIDPQGLSESEYFSERLDALADALDAPSASYGRQKWIAELAGISRQAASRWQEHDRNFKPQKKKLEPFCRALLSQYGLDIAGSELVNWLRDGAYTPGQKAQDNATIHSLPESEVSHIVRGLIYTTIFEATSTAGIDEKTVAEVYQLALKYYVRAVDKPSNEDLKSTVLNILDLKQKHIF